MFLLPLAASSTQVPSAITSALHQTKVALGNPPELSSWVNATDPCSWLSVTCTAGVVTAINLTGLPSTGASTPVPPVLGELTTLTSLTLGNTVLLTGMLPLEWASLTDLVELMVSDSHMNPSLSGPLPSSLSLLTGLTSIDLSSNSLTSSLPPAWSSLANMSVLNLAGNSLTSSLPPAWSSLSNLGVLNLAGNSLTSSLPPAWSSLANMSVLNLAGNSLTSSLPPAWSSLYNLGVLDLAGNSLTSSLPPAWSSLSNLGMLNLAGNSLTSSLPPAWSSLYNLGVLDLAGNSLTSSLPPAWSSLANMSVLDLAGNSLTSSLPSAWSSLVNLGVLDLAGNSLTSSLPPAWSSLSNLGMLDLAGNSLSGGIPPDWDWTGEAVTCTAGVVTAINLTSLPSTVASTTIPQTSSLPPSWTATAPAGMPALHFLTLALNTDLCVDVPTTGATLGLQTSSSSQMPVDSKHFLDDDNALSAIRERAANAGSGVGHRDRPSSMSQNAESSNRKPTGTRLAN
eukprot:gene25222-10867_t